MAKPLGNEHPVDAGQVRGRAEVALEEVIIRHGNNTLAASLYLPRANGPFPAIVMILGSDKHDRDTGGTGLTVRVFRDADHSLCRAEPVSRPTGADRAKARSRAAGPDFVPGYLETMTGWLAKTTRADAGAASSAR
jgi:hypothetical protein